MKIFKYLNQKIDNYKTQTIELVDGYSINPHFLIKKILLYENKQFVSGNYDSQGNRKWFFPLHESRANDIQKNIDLDLKNINIKSTKTNDFFRSWIAQTLLFDFLKNIGFSITLNEIVEKYPVHGNVILKKTFDDRIFEIVRPQDIIFLNPTTQDIQDTNTIQIHSYTQDDLRRMEDKWDNIDLTIQKGGIKTNDNEEQKYRIYEFYGEVPQKLLSTKSVSEKLVPYQIIYCAGEKENIPLAINKWAKDKPYKMLHYGAYKGKLWREGIIELLFPLQERYNEVNNQKARAMALSKKVFTTDDVNLLQKNITMLSDIKDGDIVPPIKPVDTRDLNLNAWNTEIEKIEKMADDICKSYEILTGEKLPANMPYRLGALSNANVMKFFNFIREKLGLFLKDVLNDWIMPQAIKSFNKEQEIELIRNDNYVSLLAKEQSQQIIDEYVLNQLANGNLPTKQEIEIIKQEIETDIRSQKVYTANIVKNMFKDFKYKFEIEITGEETNKAAIMETGINLLQVVGPDSSAGKNIIYRLSELAGFNPVDWEDFNNMSTPQTQPQTSKPNLKFTQTTTEPANQNKIL